MNMPMIDTNRVLLDVTNREQEAQIVARILNKGALRATKPTIRKDTANEYNDRCSAYTWRMVAFQISPHPAHHCMPMCAEFDLPDFGSSGLDWQAKDFGEKLHTAHAQRRELSTRLDALVDRIVNTVPKSQWHGVTRWAQVFGQAGTPQVTKEGAIIYR